MKHKLPKRMQNYLKEQSVCCKASTVSGYCLTLNYFYDYLKTQSPRKNIASLNKNVLMDYLIHLGWRDLVPYTKVNYLLAVKKYIAWEVERGKLPEELLCVLDRSKLPQVPEYLPRPLSTENDGLLMAKLRESESPYALLFLLLRQTGMRISELINLPPDCVLTGSKNEKYLKVPLGKMNNERLVPLCDESLLLIEKISTSKNKTNPQRLIGMKGSIPKIYGKLSQQFKKLIGNMTDQNKPVTFHRLRHTYATTLLTGGVSLPSLMKLLGHRRIEMTLRYAKVTPAHLRDEYLRAIRVLEKQAALVKNESVSDPAETAYPSEVIAQLASFLIKTSHGTTAQYHNLLRRLHRLQHDLAHINFSQKFKLESSRLKPWSD